MNIRPRWDMSGIIEETVEAFTRTHLTDSVLAGFAEDDPTPFPLEYSLESVALGPISDRSFRVNLRLQMMDPALRDAELSFVVEEVDGEMRASDLRCLREAKPGRLVMWSDFLRGEWVPVDC